MVGHSSGSATGVEALRHRDRFQWVSQGIICDMWGMAVRPLEDDPNHRISVPLLQISSEAFMYWKTNWEVANTVSREAETHGNISYLMTVRGTLHTSQSEFCILYPKIARYALKAAMDPIRAIDLNIDASLDFLSRVKHNQRLPFLAVLPKKKLLDVPLTDELPREHEPKENWTAVHLRIPHEMTKRLTGKLGKKAIQRRVAKGEEEVWLHERPKDMELARYVSCAREEGGRKDLKNFKQKETSNQNPVNETKRTAEEPQYQTLRDATAAVAHDI